MKFNYKKITSVLASAVMIGSTIGIAAAVAYPAPFVKNGQADVALVWGDSGANTDLAAVVDITADLNAKLASQTASGSTTGSGGSTITGGDFVKLQRSTDMFNLNERMNTFYSTLDDDELSAVLAPGTYQNDANDDFEYDQQITLGNAQLTHFVDSELDDNDKPYIGFDLSSGDTILNYTLDFTPDAAQGGTDFADLESTELTMLGRTYYVAQAEGTSNGVKLTLLDTANSATVVEGESATMNVGDSSYDIMLDAVDSNTAFLVVNGKSIEVDKGSVSKVGNNTYIAVKQIIDNSGSDTRKSKVEFSLGSGRIILENGQQVVINNDDVNDISDSSLVARITNVSGTDIDKIVLEWTLDDDAWIVPGHDLVLPGFETVKLSMGGFTTPMQEKTTVKPYSDDALTLNTEVTDGDVSFQFLYGNGVNFTGIGKSATAKLGTSPSSNIAVDEQDNDWFVASWKSGDESESYVLSIDDISSNDEAKNTTQIKSVVSGSNKGVNLDVGETEDLGRVKLTLVKADHATGAVNLTISSNSGSVYLDRIFTKEGMQIQLPVVGVTNVNGGINFTAGGHTTSWKMAFTEEDEDGNIAAGSSFNVTAGYASEQTSVTAVSVTDYELESGSDDFVGYMPTALATKTLLKTGGDQDEVEIEYHGEESSADVYLSEVGAVVSGNSNETNSQTIGSVSVKASEVATVSAKNLIVVGGSCVNTVAAKLLGSDTALCGDQFTTSTGVAAGQYLIQSFASPYSASKVATLVAGYNAGDTSNAAAYLTKGVPAVDTTVGKKYLGTTATAATAQVA